MSELIKNRKEILFIYEVKDCNPNGDPLDENRPRMDPETRVATITDVRIKRTIRDYLHQNKGLEILVRDTFDGQGYLKDGKGRCDDFIKDAGVEKSDSITQMVNKTQAKILEYCIDARLFGTTLPVEFAGKRGSIKITGPVQFGGFSRSLHRVDPQYRQITAGFASGKNMTQRSFGEDHIVPYACIAVYGVINEVSARTTGLTEDDVKVLYDGLWHGTESLITRSKVGHKPLALMVVSYNNGSRIGDLPGLIKLSKLRDDLDDEAIRSVNDYRIDIGELFDALKNNKHIVDIRVKQDSRLVFQDSEGKTGALLDLLKTGDLPCGELQLG